MKKIEKVSIPDSKLVETIEYHINNGYTLLSVCYTGATMVTDTGGFQEVVLIFQINSK